MTRPAVAVSTFRCAVLTAMMLVVPFGAFAAEGGKPTPSEGIFLLQIILLLVCGRLLGEVAQRLGQPAVMGQLIAGIILGPSIFGAIAPTFQHAVFPESHEQKSMLDALSQLGILMLLLLTGMETDVSVIRSSRRAALSASLSGIAVPFAFGMALGLYLPDQILPDPGRRLITSLFLGTALSISSVKIVAMTVRELGFMRRLVGQVMVASAIIDDTIGWVIMAITFGIAGYGGAGHGPSAGGIDLISVGRSVIGTGLFLLASFTIGPRIVFKLIRWSNDNFVMEMPVITTILVVMGVMALITNAIGVNTVLGAFVAGVLVGQSPILTKHIDEQLRGLIVALFMPVFFGLAGQHTNLSLLLNGPMLLLALGMMVIASLGKFLGAFIGGAAGGMTWRESLALGCGMNARGSTEVIVATLGMSMGVLSEGLFTAIVVMAVLTTLAMPPSLRWALSRIPPRPDEEQRLDREAMEARGFVSNFERLLVAVDRGASGRLASRIAGFLAGTGRMITTVLPVDDEGGSSSSDAVPRDSPSPEVDQHDEAEAEVKAAGEQVGAAGSDPSRPSPPLDVETRRHQQPVEEAVPEQAKKGYDFLVVGVEPAVEGDKFSERVTRAVKGFDGPFALVIARGTLRDDPDKSGRDILVPVTGTPYSRHGAEIALALAHATNATVTALYVTGRPRHDPTTRFDPGWAEDDVADAILREIVDMGARQGVTVKPLLRRLVTPGSAIQREMRRGGHDMIVMGVSHRPGGTLFFGDVADVIVKRSNLSIILVSS